MALVKGSCKSVEFTKDVCDLVCHALETVVQVGELGVLALDCTGVAIRKLLWSTGESVELLKLGALLWLLACDGGGCGDYKLADFERVWVLGCRGRQTKEVAWWQVDLLTGETVVAVNLDLESMVTVLDAQLAWATKVAVRVVAVSEGQAVKGVVVFETGRAIVQETTDSTTTTAVLVNDEGQTIELANGIDAIVADGFPTILDEPDLQVPTSSLLTGCTELDFGRPFWLCNTGVSPQSAARGSGGRSQNDAVGEELRHVVLSGQMPTRDGTTIGRNGILVAERCCLNHILRLGTCREEEPRQRGSGGSGDHGVYGEGGYMQGMTATGLLFKWSSQRECCTRSGRGRASRVAEIGNGDPAYDENNSELVYFLDGIYNVGGAVERVFDAEVAGVLDVDMLHEFECLPSLFQEARRQYRGFFGCPLMLHARLPALSLRQAKPGSGRG